MGQSSLEHDRLRYRGVVDDQQDQGNVAECLIKELRKRPPNHQIGKVHRPKAQAFARSLQFWPGTVGAAKYEDRPPVRRATHRFIMAARTKGGRGTGKKETAMLQDTSLNSGARDAEAWVGLLCTQIAEMHGPELHGGAGRSLPQVR